MVHHGWGLREISQRDDAAAFVEALATDYTALELPPDERAMLDYAAKLTRKPGAMQPEDVVALREAGFADGAIHDICAVAGYFAFVNRIADGLGVELEDFHKTDPLVDLPL